MYVCTTYNFLLLPNCAQSCQYKGVEVSKQSIVQLQIRYNRALRANKWMTQKIDALADFAMPSFSHFIIVSKVAASDRPSSLIYGNNNHSQVRCCNYRFGGFRLSLGRSISAFVLNTSKLIEFMRSNRAKQHLCRNFDTFCNSLTLVTANPGTVKQGKRSLRSSIDWQTGGENPRFFSFVGWFFGTARSPLMIHDHLPTNSWDQGTVWPRIGYTTTEEHTVRFLCF